MSWTASALVHAAVLAPLAFRSQPPILQPSSALRGNGGGVGVVYTIAGVANRSAEAVAEEPVRTKLALKRARQKSKKSTPVPEAALAQAASATPGSPGFVLGSTALGDPSSHDIRIAYPVVHPDPAITRARIPDWIRGDVIVEVTIDNTGAVTDTKVLQSIGFGVEDAIVATLRAWHFTPATIDGRPVASRQDVHYHFPS